MKKPNKEKENRQATGALLVILVAAEVMAWLLFGCCQAPTTKAPKRPLDVTGIIASVRVALSSFGYFLALVRLLPGANHKSPQTPFWMSLSLGS